MPTIPTQGSNVIDEGNPDYYFTGDRTSGTIRCKEGHVFVDSHSLSNNDENIGVINYSQDGWLHQNGGPGSWATGTGSITCERKYCDPLGIVDSNKEYDVLVDQQGPPIPNTVKCNDGYIFDTTETKYGNVKCGIIPRMSGLNEENDVTWIADYPYAEEFCSRLSETDCEISEINHMISKDPNKIWDDNSPINTKLSCTWIPELNDNGFDRSNGQCKFIHRADLNDGNPICRGKYCNSTPVLNSNRIEEMVGPLPGPENGTTHGNCVDFDGQIMSDIINSSDCACRKHRSCSTCSSNQNCKWCGYDSDGSGGFCYNKKTFIDLCKTSTSSNRGGSCNHAKTNIDKPNPPPEGWNRETCETNSCVNKDYWSGLQVYATETLDGLVNYNDTLDETMCTINDTEWDNHAKKHYNDTCILKNKNLDDYQLTYPGEGVYYPVTDGSTVKLNISDEICVPNSSPTALADIYTCDIHKNETDCTTGAAGATSCKWIDNPIKDSLINWHDNKTVDFSSNIPANCPITGGQNIDANKYRYTISKTTDGYIELSGENDSPATPSATTITDYNGVDPLHNCRIVNIQSNRNMIDSHTCDTVLELPGMSPLHNPTGDDCEAPGIKYCKADSGLCDPDGPQSFRISPDSNAIPGCRYYSDESLLPQNESTSQCHGNVDYDCSIPSSDRYSCHKPMLNDTDRNTEDCMDTSYSVNGNLVKPANNKDDMFKSYIICNTAASGEDTIYEEDRCNLIGSENAYWGGQCIEQGSLTNKYSQKQICEGLDEPYTWGKYIYNADQFGWGCFDTSGKKLSYSQICNLVANSENNASDIEYTNIPTNNPLINIDDLFSTLTTNEKIIIIKCSSDSTSRLQGSGLQQGIDNVAQGTVTQDGVTGDYQGYYNDNDNNGYIIVKLNTDDPVNEFSRSTDISVNITTPVGTPVLIPSSDIIDILTPLKHLGAADNCIIDGLQPAGGDDSIILNSLTNTCTNFENHDIGFDFQSNDNNVILQGMCRYKNRGESPEEIEIKNKDICTNDNNTYVTRYNYNDTNTCESINSTLEKPDLPTTWTGGEIKNRDDGTHTSECSPSIMSSCNVSCDSGYGGGGEYICSYNSEGSDMCNDIDNKNYDGATITKEKLCKSIPTCVYTNDTCSFNTTDRDTDGNPFEEDGHMEWLGSPCYKIDNTGFSHGIAELPELDEFISPFSRVFWSMFFYILIITGILFIISKYLLKNIGGTIDFTINKSLDGANKLIDAVTDSDKLIKIIMSPTPKPAEKLLIVGGVIGLLVGVYYLSKNIKNNVRKILSNMGDSINEIIQFIKNIRVSEDKRVVADDDDDGDIFKINLGQAYGAVSDGTSGLIDRTATTGNTVVNTVKQATLTTVVQIAVAVVVISIIIMFIFKSDMIGVSRSV